MDRRAFLVATALFGGLALRLDTLRAATDDAGVATPGADAANDADAVPPPAPFDFERVAATAARLAAGKYAKRQIELKGDFASLTYDQYRDIRYKGENSPWATSPSNFRLDLMPPGFYFKTPVAINLIEDGVPRPLAFTLDDFTFGPLAPQPPSADGLAFSGFRLRYPINSPDVMDEVAVFQGASYFRAIARSQLYGLSARGLAIGTAAERGEEFPDFVEFWIESPPADATSVKVWALLDSPSVAGAYQFDIRPGADTMMQVRSALFPRRDIDDVGIAPLTSMFLFDTSNRIRFDDYREAVHDSDGLQMIRGDGERLFRSLANPARLQVSAFLDTDPKAFGLVQRHRSFGDYEDAEARYDLRPGAWIQPDGAWGKGSVLLVEIPTDLEIHDNIVAFWRPAGTLAGGRRHDFGYRLSWTGSPADDIGLWRVSDLRAGVRAAATTREIVIDFRAANGAPSATDGGTALTPDLSISAGEAMNVTGTRVDPGRYRVSFDFDPKDTELSEMRLRLLGTDGKPASETWLYRWTT